MNTVAIVSQGPTAEFYDGQANGYAAVIGVNAIPTRWSCSHWVFSDWDAFVKHYAHDGGGRWCDHVIGKPEIWTRPGNREKLFSQKPDVKDTADTFQWRSLAECGLPSFPTGGLNWMRHGGPSALGLALSMKPNRVECFGCDMVGLVDTFGLTPHAHVSRNDDRWHRERFLWNSMVELMRLQSIQVVHSVGPSEFAPWRYEVTNGRLSRRWTYDNGYGWVTYSFDAPDELAFRRLLSRMIGEGKATTVKVKELT